MDKVKYIWNEDEGVVETVGNYREQRIQLLYCGSKRFRTHCGKLLVEALNREAERQG